MSQDLQSILNLQKAAHLRDGAPSAAKRIERIDRCIGLLVDNQTQIEDALTADFGARSREASAFTDIASSISTLKHAKANLTAWMKPEKRKTSPPILALFGAKAEVLLKKLSLLESSDFCPCCMSSFLQLLIVKSNNKRPIIVKPPE